MYTSDFTVWRLTLCTSRTCCKDLEILSIKFPVQCNAVFQVLEKNHASVDDACASFVSNIAEQQNARVLFEARSVPMNVKRVLFSSKLPATGLFTTRQYIVV